MPTTNDTMSTTNVAQNVIDDNLPQLLDSRGAHEGPYDTRDTKIAALRLKFNAFKALEGENANGTFTRLKCLLNDLENNGDSDSDVEKDIRSNCEFIIDLNVEYHERALLANQKKVLQEGTTKIKAFMAIAEEESSVRKDDARSEQLLLTPIDKVKSLKEQIQVPLDNSSSVLQTRNLKSSKGKQTTWFRPLCGSVAHETTDCPKKHPNNRRPRIANKRSIEPTKKWKDETLNEVRVKELRSDNGTEFRNYKLEEFYDEKEIS
nr:hypothetical protein [Tanacetum cinerariifolium]GFA44722.1 hypothetical protein [Tanacetum cinerariifolium]